MNLLNYWCSSCYGSTDIIFFYELNPLFIIHKCLVKLLLWCWFIQFCYWTIMLITYHFVWEGKFSIFNICVSITVFYFSTLKSFSLIYYNTERPSVFILSNSFMRPIDRLMVSKLVSVPPNQRSLTKNAPQRCASETIASWACFLVPTKRMDRPWAAVSRMNL